MPTHRGDGGARPGPFDRVTIIYTGWTPGGRVFDSSVPRGEPATLAADVVNADVAFGFFLNHPGIVAQRGSVPTAQGRKTILDNGGRRVAIIFRQHIL